MAALTLLLRIIQCTCTPMHIQVCTHGHTHRPACACTCTHTVSLAKLQTHRCTCTVSEGYCNWLVVCLSVCVSVDAYSGTTGYEGAYEGYQPLLNYASLNNTKTIILIRLCSRYAVKTSEKANMHYRFPRTDPLLCTLEAQEVTRVSTPACYLLL